MVLLFLHGVLLVMSALTSEPQGNYFRASTRNGATLMFTRSAALLAYLLEGQKNLMGYEGSAERKSSFET